MSLNSDALRLFWPWWTGTMSAAAEMLGQTASGVSRGLSRLEEDLGVTLLTRTTRRMELTEEGALFLQKARGIVASLEEAEECMRMVHQQPAGRLRVDAPAPVMLHCVVPHVAEFRRAYPQITLELTSNDRIVDLMEHRSDVALRAGPLTDSTCTPARCARAALAAGQSRLHRAPGRAEGRTNCCNTSCWLHAAGKPERLAAAPRGRLQLRHHPPRWPPPAARPSTSWSCAAGIAACLSDFMVRDELADGRLVKVMEHAYTDYQPLNAVYYRNTQLSRRTLCPDFIAARM